MEILFAIINFIVGIAMIFFSIIIFHPINRYKKFKTKEDQLFLEKTLLTTIFFLTILITYIVSLFTYEKITMISFLFFNFYIIAIVLFNFFLALEIYFTFTNPVHCFNRLFKQKKYNYIPELIILITCLIILTIDFVLYRDNFNSIENKIIINIGSYISCIFIIIGKWKNFLIILISIINLVFLYKIKSKIQSFCFKSQEKLYNVIDKRIMSNYLYLVYGIYYTYHVFTDVTKLKAYYGFGYLFFIIIIINDYSLHLSIISTTKFCEYRLRRTLLQYFCSFYYKPAKPGRPNAPLVNESSLYEATGMTTFQNETSTALDIISNNQRDKELVSIYKNEIYIEDYFFNYFDQILNIMTASIYQVYNSKFFSSQANEKRLSNNIQIGGDMSSIGGTMQNLTISNLGNNNKTAITSTSEVGEDTARFDIRKNYEKDDFKGFKEVLENEINIHNNNNYLNISVKSFFTQKCVESIYDQKLKGRNIASSLLSHMILTNNAKNRNLDNPNSYFWSLLGVNGKEEYFNKLKNTSIKTYDKNFTLDIFDTNDEEINFSDKQKNNELAVLLDKYFTYIHGKGINGTFIPSLVGVFKIKINEFKTLLIFITRNSLVENIPKNFFTYWQLIRFLGSKPQKMASSQFNSGTLVKDDPIFERSFQIETRKDNPNYNKIAIKNFIDFEETVKSDIEFLNNCGSQNFDLLLMYYEYENTQKHEEQGTIKIKKTNQGTEIIEGSLPKGDIFDEVGSPISKSKIPDSPGDNFLDDNDFGGKNCNPNKNMANLIDIDEKINISGYEGVFDSFNCLCFFTFENVFDIRKRFSLAFNYYNSFKNKIMNNFTEYKSS